VSARSATSNGSTVRLLLRYGFEELNPHKVWLTTIGFNVRAQRTFERAGFVQKGVQREMIERAGRRFDLLHYGMLRDEWLARR
jgi:RimJ/RimL family protein N-acetyltransferase